MIRKKESKLKVCDGELPRSICVQHLARKKDKHLIDNDIRNSDRIRKNPKELNCIINTANMFRLVIETKIENGFKNHLLVSIPLEGVERFT